MIQQADHSGKTLILTAGDVAQVVRSVGCDTFMDHMINRLHQAFADFDPVTTATPIRDGFHYESPATGLIEWMPLHQHEGTVLIKMVGYHPMNPTMHNTPSVLSTLSLFDTATGSLTAFADGVLLTAMRTGAASAVATRLLSRDDSRCLGIVGCGAQAVTQLHAISRVRDLDVVRYCDINPDVEGTFSHRVRPLISESVHLSRCSLAEVVEESDILCTATSVAPGHGPVFRDCILKPAAHINAVGSDLAGKTELPLTVLTGSIVCPDFPDQAVCEGECQQLEASQVGPSLSELCRDPGSSSKSRDRRTVFDSTGWALEDHVALEMLSQLAVELKIGTWSQIESSLGDPWNPYEHVVSTNARLLGAS